MDDNTRMHELIKLLDEAARVYYSGEDEIMSNYEYDRLYDELAEIEARTGIVLAGSPTMRVGYETLSSLPKEAHVAPMLSLAKTKDVGELISWLGDKKGILSMKLDGLSIILTYENGELVKALTRGNGEIGEVITNNAMTFRNLPKRIPYSGRIVLRGEALIKYSDFEEMNSGIVTDDGALQYKNPRNLCSGSVRQLNNEITAKRRVHFYAYTLVELSGGEGGPEIDSGSKHEHIDFIRGLGFEVAPYRYVDGSSLQNAVDEFEKEVSVSDLPSDGLVLTYDDIEYSLSLGRTAKAPRDSIALKWQDEIAETTLEYIEWSASRTGLINPVAVFAPVELEGTTVKRASVHNVSILNELELGTGDRITVYKANMIIPQIENNLTRSGTCKPPKKCPVCDSFTKLVSENGSTVLVCPNEDCYAKQLHSLVLFVSRDALNINGLSEATLEKWVSRRYIRSCADIFRIERYRDEIINDDTMKIRDKSFDNLISAIEAAKNVKLANLIYALGIKGIGLATARDITDAFPELDFPGICALGREQLMSVNGVGESIADGFVSFFENEKNKELVMELNDILNVSRPQKADKTSAVSGKTFVITGSLNSFENRGECAGRIKDLGGRVTSAVSANTDFLVNNDINSGSSKNKKAKQLNIPIITEEELISMMDEQ